MFRFLLSAVKWLADRAGAAVVAMGTNEVIKSAGKAITRRPALTAAALCALPLIAVTVYMGSGSGSAVQTIQGEEVFGPAKPREIAVQYLERVLREGVFPGENISFGRSVAFDREQHGPIVAVELDYRDDQRRMEAQMAGMFGAEFQRDYDPDWNQEYRVDVVYSNGTVKSYMMRLSRESGTWRIDSIW
jgi:hypothetical protein